MTVQIAQGYPDWQRTFQQSGTPLINVQAAPITAAITSARFYVGNYARLQIFANTAGATISDQLFASFYTDAVGGFVTGAHNWIFNAANNVSEAIPVLGAYVEFFISRNTYPGGGTYNLQAVGMVSPVRVVDTSGGVGDVLRGAFTIAAGGNQQDQGGNVGQRIDQLHLYTDGVAWTWVIYLLAAGVGFLEYWRATNVKNGNEYHGELVMPRQAVLHQVFNQDAANHNFSYSATRMFDQF